MRQKAYLLLGSNLGNRKKFLDSAISALESADIHIVSKSSIYESPAWGIEEQPGFLNMAIEVKTDLRPDMLLATIKEIESNLGRQKRERWGPREIDIDILTYEDLAMTSDMLTIPHPGLPERSFALVPLAEIASEEHIHGKTVSELLKLRTDADQITEWHE